MKLKRLKKDKLPRTEQQENPQSLLTIFDILEILKQNQRDFRCVDYLVNYFQQPKQTFCLTTYVTVVLLSSVGYETILNHMEDAWKLFNIPTNILKCSHVKNLHQCVFGKDDCDCQMEGNRWKVVQHNDLLVILNHAILFRQQHIIDYFIENHPGLILAVCGLFIPVCPQPVIFYMIQMGHISLLQSFCKHLNENDLQLILDYKDHRSVVEYSIVQNKYHIASWFLSRYPTLPGEKSFEYLLQIIHGYKRADLVPKLWSQICTEQQDFVFDQAIQFGHESVVTTLMDIEANFVNLATLNKTVIYNHLHILKHLLQTYFYDKNLYDLLTTTQDTENLLDLAFTHYRSEIFCFILETITANAPFVLSDGGFWNSVFHHDFWKSKKNLLFSPDFSKMFVSAVSHGMLLPVECANFSNITLMLTCIKGFEKRMQFVVQHSGLFQYITSKSLIRLIIKYTVSFDDITKGTKKLFAKKRKKKLMGCSSTKDVKKPTNISCIHADITTLRIDAIVNASNTSGLGCFIPNHCIDSAIHAAAGPHLYDACKKLNGISTGQAKITPAFWLPCEWIIHTTGPEYNPEIDRHFDFDMLANCYKNSLNLAKKYDVKQIAFPCISTGMFGYPKFQSAAVAIQTVRDWVASHKPVFTDIFFVVYDYENQSIYNDLLLLQDSNEDGEN